VMDSSDANRDFGWSVEFPMAQLFEEIAQHAESHPDWLEMSGLEKIQAAQRMPRSESVHG